MMNRINRFCFFVGVLSLFFLKGAIATGKYGFSASDIGNSCGLANTLFPLSFKYNQGDGKLVNMKFNVFYVHNGVDGMDDYVDFYTSTEGGVAYWPTAPVLAKGKDKPLCTGTQECVTPGKGGINKGVSDYTRLAQQYPADGQLKIIADIAPTDGSRYKYLIDTRKLKLLRVEVFTPYTDNTPMHVGYVEPAYFEYVSDGGNTMKLTSSGTTAPNYTSTFTSSLPQEINLNLLSDIQIDLTGGSNFSDKRPQVKFVDLNPTLMNKVPAACK